MKFHVKLQKLPREISELFKTVYGDSTKKSTVFNWQECFRQSREDVNDDERQGARVML
jgi:hypothetical protein